MLKVTVLLSLLYCVFAWNSPWTGPLNLNDAPVQNYARHCAHAVNARNHHEHNYIFEVFGMEENLTTQVLHGAAASVTAVFSGTRKFDTVTQTWSAIVSTNGIEPPARGAACSALVEVNGTRKVYIFGGAKLGYAPQKDSFWVHDLDAGTWTNMTQKGSPTFPSARLGCGAHAWMDGFFMFGGIGLNPANPTQFLGNNELWYFNATESVWALISTQGTAPSPAWFVNVFISNSDLNTLKVFGGETGNPNTADGAFFENVEFEFDIPTLTWSQITPIVPLPRVRWHCAMGLYDNGDESQVICHSGDYGSCSSLVLLVPSTAVKDVSANVWFDGVVPLYASTMPRSKAARLVCFDNGKCYHTGGFGGINCDMSEQIYLNAVYAYDPTNRAYNVAQSFNN